jgi:hypothetical protein
MEYKIKVKYKAEKTHVIVRCLKSGIKPTNLVKKGYPKSTVFYHYNKLFFPQKHVTLMSQIHKYKLAAKKKAQKAVKSYPQS